MARELPYIAAIGEAIHEEMERDDTVLYFGRTSRPPRTTRFSRLSGPTASG